MRRRGACPTATWCGCSTTAGPAWQAWWSTTRLRPDVVQLSTGAWFDPADPADPDAMCVHGNPNVLTDDVGTSSLARGCTGAHVLVQVEKFTGDSAAGTVPARAAGDRRRDDRAPLTVAE